MKNQLEERLIAVRPNERQLRQEEMEFYGFVHFSMNTFTGKEWGDGTDSPEGGGPGCRRGIRTASSCAARPHFPTPNSS